MRNIVHAALGIALAGMLAVPLAAQEDVPITACVVNEEGELVAIDAFRAGDALFVVEDGERVVLTEAYPATTPLYVRSADWFIRDQPLALIDDDELTDEQDEALEDLEQAREEIEEGELEDAAEHLREASAGFDASRFEFVRFGTTTAIPATDVGSLVFLGTVDGTPVYARRADLNVRTRDRLDRYHRTTTDLEVILMADRRLADEIATTEPIYVAVEPGTRCLLQPLNPVRMIRRTQG